MTTCPSCQSEKTRRGGTTIWTIYAVLIALALVAVLFFHFNAAVVAGIMIAVIIAANLILNQRVCLECGTQF